MKETKQLYDEAMNKWGLESQMDMLIEECSELIKAVCKAKRTNFNDKQAIDNLNEEITDVTIMIEQIIHAYDMPEIIAKIKADKLIRLHKLLHPTQ
jgi:NTP pyrophosphatase (non-canonical NTP hydrolase)